MSLKKKIIGESFIYGLSRYASFLAALFLTPIYTRLLTKADYGVMDIFNKWNMFAISIIPLGLYNALIRFYPEAQKNEESKRKLLGSIFTGLVILSFLYIFLMLSIKTFFIDSLVERAFSGIDQIYFFSLGLVCFQVIFNYALQMLRMYHNSKAYAVLSLTNFCILTAFGFYYIYFQGENILGFFRASLISSSVSMLTGLLVIRKDIHWLIDFQELKRLLSYSIYFLSVFFLFQVTDIIDRYLIKTFYTLDEVGIYSIGSRLSSVILIATSAVSLAWMPYAIEIKDRKDSDNIYRRMFNAYVIAGFVLVSILIVLKQELITVFAPSYGDSAIIVVLLSTFNFLMGFVYVFTIGIQLSKKTWVLPIAAITAVLVKLVLSITLIGPYGISGIAFASVLEAIIWVGIQHLYSQRFWRISFNYWILIYPLSILLVYYASSLADDEASLINKALLLLAISGIALFHFKKLAYK